MIDYRESMEECVPKLLECLEQVVVSSREFEEIQANYQLHHDVKSLLVEARNEPEHILRTLPYRSVSTLQVSIYTTGQYLHYRSVSSYITG